MTPERFKKIRSILDARQPDLTVLMENVHKPHNIAAIMRSCDAVGVLKTHAVAPSGLDLKNPSAAAGTRHWVPLKTFRAFDAAQQHLKAGGHTLVAAHPSPDAVDFKDYDYTRPTAIILGSELFGLSDEAIAKADVIVNIPIMGMIQSLNVSVCAALILYEAQRQRQAAGLYDNCRLDSEEYKKLLFEWSWPRVAHRMRQSGMPYPELDPQTGDLIKGTSE